MHRALKAYVGITERSGQTMTEYALILAAIAVVAYLAYFNLGDEVSELLSNVANLL